jgi:hypothetical protein
MRFSMRLIVAGLVLLCMGVAWLGAQQPHDGGDIQRESTAGNRGSMTQAVECSPPPRSRGMYY